MVQRFVLYNNINPSIYVFQCIGKHIDWRIHIAVKYKTLHYQVGNIL